ncbi:DUF6443 domain-containing protein [Sediminibacterium soli]|uniref:DUF6443 domain-containing protein n=1 Tax=Sediminibacterium soli TaxID=2698829 RepID=UPI0013793C51|nr:DUF6443 domain-containing protein [Sediminibacterium soli]NCI45661.1 hypothetical protein [Sediminibacterium soli]
MKTIPIRQTVTALAVLLTAAVNTTRAQLPFPAAYPLDTRINYVRTWEAHAPTQNPSTLIAAPLRNAKQSTVYLDGLGRTLQTVAKQGSLPTGGSAADIIQSALYDELGRELVRYLPTVANGTGGNTSISDGAFKYNPFQQDSVFNTARFANESFFYSQSVVEASPLARTIKEMPAGNSWSGNGKGTAHRYLNNNTGDSVVIWDITGNANPVFNGYYAAGALTRHDITDEQGMTVQEFVDKSGKTLLKKVQISASAGTLPSGAYTGWLSTGYVYDNLGNLRFVISPKAMAAIAGSWTIGSGIADELCFAYGYDEQNRMVTKKVPGAGVVEMVYDTRDRLVMTRDGNLLSAGKWMVTVYENTLNRPVQTGLLADASTRATHAAAAASSAGYPSVASGFELLTETFYDGYGWVTGTGLSATLVTGAIHAPEFLTTYLASPEFAEPVTATAAVNGMVTGTKVKVLGTNTYLYSVNHYDAKGRRIQTQQTNISGGTDIGTTQYDWSGRPLRVLLQHQKSSGNAQTHTLLTINEYDDAGRLATVKKEIDGTGIRQTSASSYDGLGLLAAKTLDNSLETLQYDYNIRGWLLGMNREYVKDASQAYFGFELAYDKTANIIPGSGYAAAQYNGNIAGTTWKSRGDAEKRKYDFAYDGANRLLKADFTQYTSGSFSTSAMDFSAKMGDGSDANTAYDANGNILRMRHSGLKNGATQLIDDLSYNYITGSNKLLNVNDAQNDAQTVIGDFRTSQLHPSFGAKTTSTEDYAYDANGNLIKDLNKDIIDYSGSNGISYNHLNLPASITVRGASGNKGTIVYLYDAQGNKLQKTVTEGSSTITQQYISGFEYRNDTLQLAMHEEGRIRKVDSSLVYDYFLKDHLGNTRAVLTTERKTDGYPAATMETGSAWVENSLYENIDSTRSGLPAGYPTDTYTEPNEYVAKLNASTGKKIGPAILLKVMAGDSVNIRCSSWYRLNGTTPGDPASPLTDLLVNLAKGITSVSGLKYTQPQLSNTLLPPGITDLLNGRNTGFNSSRPKAYLSWVLLDEQFHYVSGSSGFEQVGADTVLTTWVKTALLMSKNGYLYVYTGNESEINVYFDNLQVSHVRGPLLEETHYYPFGLTMAGISSKVAGKPENRFKYNGKDLQNKEFSDGSGLELYDYGKRMGDPQLGRWWVLDPKADLLEMSTPYAFCYNNPIIYTDPDGELAILINGRVTAESQRGNASYWDRGVIEAIKSSGIPNSSNMMFVDGDRFRRHEWPGSNGDYDEWGGIQNGAYTQGNSAEGRRKAGYQSGKDDFKSILARLARDPKTNKIIEKIEIYTHSRGAAFGAGYTEALMEMIQKNADQFADPQNVIDLVYNMAPNEADRDGTAEPGGVNAYSQHHNNDFLSGAGQQGTKANFVSKETAGGLFGPHSTSSFVKDITAFTKAFANSTNKKDSKKIIRDFINAMQQYGITVTVQQ